MRNVLLISIGAGLVSALAFASAMLGPTAAGFFLLCIAALPIYVVGLGWTYAAALLASAISSLVLTYFAKDAGMAFASLIGGPAVVLTYFAGIVRAVPDGAGGVRLQGTSPGALVIAAAFVSSLIALLVSVAMHDQMDTAKDSIRKALEGLEQLPQAARTPENLTQLVDDVIALIPAAVAMLLMLVSLLNLWLAARLAAAAGHLPLPWPDIAAMRFPRGTPLILSAALIIGSMQTGAVSAAATGVGGAFFAAYLLLGLAVIHYVTRGKSWRPFALGAAYASLPLTSFWAALPLIMLGLVDTVFSLRRPPPTGSGSGTT